MLLGESEETNSFSWAQLSAAVACELVKKDECKWESTQTGFSVNHNTYHWSEAGNTFIEQSLFLYKSQINILGDSKI